MPDPLVPRHPARSAGPGDHDVGPRVPRRPRRVPWPTLTVVSAGGILGALARYGVSAKFPHPAGAFGWATFWINVAGCALIGVLMVMITEVGRAHPLARPFLGVGVLGGFTTFSTYVVDVQRAVAAGAPGTALAYLAGTVAAALAAVYAGVHGTRLFVRSRRDHPRSHARARARARARHEGAGHEGGP